MGCGASVAPPLHEEDDPPEKVTLASPRAGDTSPAAHSGVQPASTAVPVSPQQTSPYASANLSFKKGLAFGEEDTSQGIRRMQKVFRGILLRRRVVDQIKFAMWNQLDEWEELELLTVGKMIEDMVRGSESPATEDDTGIAHDWSVASSSAEIDDKIKPEQPPPAPPPLRQSITSPLLPPQLHKSDVLAIVGSLQHGERLPRGVVAELLQRQAALLRSQPNVLRMTIKPNQTLAVVGDLHGQFADLLHIFSLNGLPGENSMFLFNGDFVDRGPKSLEVVLSLFAWQQCYPNHVFLNRGNHEESAVNAMYGFLADCAIKYDRDIYNMFDETFRWLPLASIIDNVALVLHAGIATGLTIKMLEELPRAMYTMDVKRDGSVKPAHYSRVVETVLWSDPQAKAGCVSNKKRGVGCRFGPDVASDFMRQEGLKLMVRSHECVMEGLEWPFGGPDTEPRVCTLFSASNYGSKTLNKGAFLVMSCGAADNPKAVKYEAEQVSTQQVDLKNIKFVAQLIVERKVDLRRAFVDADDEQTGVISISRWANAIGSTLSLHLPWINLHPMLASNCTSSKGVEYESFLQQFQPQASKAGGALTKDQTSLIEILCSRCQHLGAMLLRMDRDGTGVVTVTEIGRIFRMVGQRFPDARALFVEHPENILSLLGIEPSAEGTIQIESFVDAFRVKADWIAEKQVPTVTMPLTHNGTLKAQASRRPNDPRAVFKLARMVQNVGKGKHATANMLMHNKGSAGAMRSTKNLCG
mmetsp:Transcript_15906/g.39866  ORF Transcript_15906/g.39866 Transcript_15906/m.39866 type:complete len:753 (-) Transcript_15906:377-2635(-)